MQPLQVTIGFDPVPHMIPGTPRGDDSDEIIVRDDSEIQGYLDPGVKGPQGSSFFEGLGEGAPEIPQDPIRSMLIVVGIVSLIAIGVFVAVGVAVIGWPVWVPVVIGAMGVILIGCVAFAIFRACQAVPEVREISEQRTDYARRTVANLQTMRTIDDLDDVNFPTELPYRTVRQIETKERFIAEGQCKKVYEVGENLVWVVAKPGQEDVLLDEVGCVQRIESEVKAVLKRAEDRPMPETESCLALGARIVIPLAGEHAPRFVASRYFGDLDRLFSDKNPTPPTLVDILTIIFDIGTGMNYLHQVGYTHGDMQMGNVLVKQVDGRWRAAITDFGQTTTVGDTGDAGVLHGHWSYSSPEQRRHQPSDVYGMGLLAAWLMERGVLGRAQEETIASQFPVAVGDRGLVAFAKTGVRRAAGALGELTGARSAFIVYHPQRQIHDYLDGLVAPLTAAGVANAAKWVDLLKEMTLDNPWENIDGQGERINMPEVMERLTDLRDVPPALVPQPVGGIFKGQEFVTLVTPTPLGAGARRKSEEAALKIVGRRMDEWGDNLDEVVEVY